MTDQAADREREARIRKRKVRDRGRVEIDLLHLLDCRTGPMEGPMERLLAHDAAQRAEIERYREALEEIVEAHGIPGFADRHRAANRKMKEIAHRALNTGDDDESV